MEHEFVKPNLDQIEDFIDVVSLFLASTEVFLNHLPDSAEICQGLEYYDHCLDIEYDNVQSKFTLDMVLRDEESIKKCLEQGFFDNDKLLSNTKTEEFVVSINDNRKAYDEILKQYIRITIRRNKIM